MFDSYSVSLIEECPLAVTGRTVFMYYSQDSLFLLLMLRSIPEIMICGLGGIKNGYHCVCFFKRDNLIQS